jgi:hypothetical protein
MLKPTIWKDPSRRFGGGSLIARFSNLYGLAARIVGLSRFAVRVRLLKVTNVNAERDLLRDAWIRALQRHSALEHRDLSP